MGDGSWRVEVDRGVCIGSGVCAGSAPEYFRLEDNRSWPVREEVEPDEMVLAVAESCPTEAITVRDADGKQLAP
jgi:ferredoxin